MNNERDFGMDLIFWDGPRSETREGFIDFVPLPELSVLASSAISTAILDFRSFLEFRLSYFKSLNGR